MDMTVAFFVAVSKVLTESIDVASIGIGMGLDGAVNCS